MPRPNFWHFTLAEDSPEKGVYVTVGTQILTKYGHIKEIRTSSKDREGSIKVTISKDAVE